MVKTLILLFFLLPFILKGQDTIVKDTGHFTALSFDKNTYDFLIGVRSYAPFDSLMKRRNVYFDPIPLKDSSYFLNPLSLSDINFAEIVDSVKRTSWQDSIEIKLIPDSLLVK